MKTLTFTCGDINGIGPEICIKTINEIFNPSERKIIFYCPGNVFESTSALVQPSFNFTFSSNKYDPTINSDSVSIVDIGISKQIIGKPTSVSGKAAYIALKSAAELNLRKYSDAVITAPVSKTAFNLAKIKYPGQTEILANLSKSKKYLMVFLSEEMICGLTTIHIPIKSVSARLTTTQLKSSIKVLYQTLQNDLGIEFPKIAVLGLNPHAGENGKIGREEVDVIRPAIKYFKKIFIEGPFVPDAFFGMKKYEDFNAVLGIYHDQVLIPFKLLNFNKGVNYTAGLPIIRTSPDHGTAFDIAGKGIADHQSMVEAVRWAELIISNRRKR